MISPTKEDTEFILYDQQINAFPLPSPQKGKQSLV